MLNEKTHKLASESIDTYASLSPSGNLLVAAGPGLKPTVASAACSLASTLAVAPCASLKQRREGKRKGKRAVKLWERGKYAIHIYQRYYLDFLFRTEMQRCSRPNESWQATAASMRSSWGDHGTSHRLFATWILQARRRAQSNDQSRTG
jgi:hypothetical protein